MRRVRAVRWACAWGLLLAVSAPSPARGQDRSLESKVVFATNCARCHEAECSGRLSFDAGSQASVEHVRRHAGRIEDGAARELVRLLEQMKTECAHPRFSVTAPPDGVWPASLLARLCTRARRSCVVPLGALEPGDWVLEVRLAESGHVHAEVVTRRFDHLFDEPLELEAGRATLRFPVEERAEPFLRLRARDPMRLLGLRQRREPGSAP